MSDAVFMLSHDSMAMLSDDNNDNNVHDDKYEAQFWQETKWTPDRVTLCDIATQSAWFKLIFPKLIINGGNQKQRKSY